MLALEAERLLRRYIDEVVDPFTLCPWAKPSEFAVTVWEQATITPLELHPLLDNYEANVVLIACPRIDAEQMQWRKIVESLGRGLSVWALAAFHPRPTLDTRSAATFVPYLRRTPDPTIQCTRFSKLRGLTVTGSVYGGDNAGALMGWPSTKDPSTAVTEANFARLSGDNLARLTRAQDSIIADRETSYRALGVPG